MYLTKIFRQFGVDFLGEEIITLHHIYTYTYESYIRIGYTFDNIWKACYQHIDTKDIYVYSCETPAHYLYKGYSGPINTSHQDEDDKPQADEARLSDVALPLDYLLIANPDMPCQTRRHGPNRSHTSSFTDLKTYL